ncbi:hypothetical protein DXG01_000740 [Tephrocybe rancida]|nr:hypothetical protein DXG01_000740 [Tephrocybe rancida]
MAQSTRYSSSVEPRRHIKPSAMAATTSKQGERDILVIWSPGALGAVSPYAGVVGLRVGGMRWAGKELVASGPALKADKMERNGPRVGTTHALALAVCELSTMTGLRASAQRRDDEVKTHALAPAASEASGPAPKGETTIERTDARTCRASEVGAPGPALKAETTTETENDTLRASKALELAPRGKDSRLKKSTMGGFVFRKRELMSTTREKKSRDVAVEVMPAEFSKEPVTTFSDWGARNDKRMASSPEGAAAERSDDQGGKYGRYGELSEEQMATFADWAARNGKRASLESDVSSALALGLEDGQVGHGKSVLGSFVDMEWTTKKIREEKPTSFESVANYVIEPPIPPTINTDNGEAEWSVVTPTRKARWRRDKGEEGASESGREVGVTYREAACAGADTCAYDGGEGWDGGWSWATWGRRGWA